MNKADELIACLEGEIAKRDETIARLEPQLNRAIQANYDMREELAACRVAVENCELFRARIAELEDDLKCAHSMLSEVSKAGMALRAELAAIKAQEPVAEVKHGPLDSSGWPEFVRVKTIGDFDLENLPNGMKFYAAPVSESKAQGVVILDESQEAAEFESQFQGCKAFMRDSHASEAAGKYVCQRSHMFKVWMHFRAMLAAPAAPAADAGLVEALDLAANRLDRLALEHDEFWRGYATAWADEARATANGVKS